MGDDFQARIFAAELDERSAEVRIALGKGLATAFTQVGQLLWVQGHLIEDDRRLGDSLNGDDGIVGLALIAQIAGELCSGVVALLEIGNDYGAAALVRQLVEVEYLAYSFENDGSRAQQWLRSSATERRRSWQPGNLRQLADGQFRGSDYGHHCERGGHPTPVAAHLLPNHNRDHASIWWLELAAHGSSSWNYMTEAGVSCKAAFGVVRDGLSLDQLHDAWHKSDRLYAAFGDVRQFLDRTN
jgi:hypothetical protein